MSEETKPKKSIWKKWWFWGIIFVFAVILIASGGENGKKPEEQPSQGQAQPTEEQHFIDFDVSLEGKNLTLNGNTNIPDGSVLTISTNRYVEYTELEGKRVVALDDGETTVKNGAFTYSAYLTDKEWYEKDLEENELLGIDFKKIYEDCYVLITFTPKVEQPKEVYEILGDNFEKLNIKESSGSFKSIQTKKGFELALEEGL